MQETENSKNPSSTMEVRCESQKRIWPIMVGFAVEISRKLERRLTDFQIVSKIEMAIYRNRGIISRGQ